MGTEKHTDDLIDNKSIVERLDKAEQLRQDAVKDLIAERERLVTKLTDIDALLRKCGSNSAPKAPTPAAGNKTMTVKAAIINALEDGEEKKVAEIVDRASKIAGKTLTAPAVSEALMQLQKAKTIVSKVRGSYKIK